MVLKLLNFFGGINLFGTSKASNEGISSRKIKRDIWSRSGETFHTLLPDADDVHYVQNTGKLVIDTMSGDDSVQTGVSIPNGAIIERVIVYGSRGTETHSLQRIDLTAGTSSLITSGLVNVFADANETVDVEKFGYVLEVSTTDGDEIYGALIEYTT